MRFDETFDVTNPAELAKPLAIDLCMRNDIHEPAITPVEGFRVEQINKAVGYLGLRGKYWVEAGRAWISRPINIVQGAKDNIGEFSGLTFEGNFFRYDLVKIDGPEIDEKRKIRALCMEFTGSILLPFCDKLSGDNMVYVPVFAVDDMSRTDKSNNL